MHIFLFSGIAVSLLITELTGFSPGGIVVVGYLSIFMMQPKWLIGTLLASLVTYFLVETVRSYTLLYGRRLFAIYLLTGIAVTQAAREFSMLGLISDFGLLIVGYLVPGLIAKDCSRQGILQTMLWLILGILLTRLIVLTGEGMIW